MSDPRSNGPIPALAGVASDEWKKHQSQPPHRKADNKVYLGGFTLGGLGYVVLNGPSLASYPGDWQIGFAVVFGFAALLLVTGWRVRGPRDLVGAFFSVALPLGGYLAVNSYAPDLLDNFYARAFLAAVVCGNIVRFWLCVRGPGGDAQKIVNRQISQNEIHWQGVKRRR